MFYSLLKVRLYHFYAIVHNVVFGIKNEIVIFEFNHFDLFIEI